MCRYFLPNSCDGQREIRLDVNFLFCVFTKLNIFIDPPNAQVRHHQNTTESWVFSSVLIITSLKAKPIHAHHSVIENQWFYRSENISLYSEIKTWLFYLQKLRQELFLAPIGALVVMMRSLWWCTHSSDAIDATKVTVSRLNRINAIYVILQTNVQTRSLKRLIRCLNCIHKYQQCFFAV